MFQHLFGIKNSQAQMTTEVDAHEAQRLQQTGAQLIDVREPFEFATGHAKGAINIPLSKLTHYIGEVRTDTPVLVICLSGGRSRSAQDFLRRQNISDVRNVKGGTSAWQAAKLPTE
jgi:rhodanese-related sulfurtransferase